MCPVELNDSREVRETLVSNQELVATTAHNVVAHFSVLTREGEGREGLGLGLGEGEGGGEGGGKGGGEGKGGGRGELLPSTQLHLCCLHTHARTHTHTGPMCTHAHVPSICCLQLLGWSN